MSYRKINLSIIFIKNNPTMHRLLRCYLIIVVFSSAAYSQEKVKNLILMIPDGTSSSVLSIARWHKCGVSAADNCRLAVDPYICGLVSTSNSDAPIGDSAPTGSAYATGYLSNTGFIATYPVSSGKENDLFPVDVPRSYHPLATILEAAKSTGKQTGLVVTCQFPHATPAAFASHTPDRGDLEAIARQIVHNRLNLVFGGGLQYLDPAIRKDGSDLLSSLRARNYMLITKRDQFDALTSHDTLVYGLFADNYLPFEAKRNPAEVPSLAEMTRKAIRILSENPRGFFLLVEGSKGDWAAHDNDAAGVISEFLAFDEAVKEAMSFANRDGYTAVVVCPDHGCGGITMGNALSDTTYDTLPVSAFRDARYLGFTTHGHTGEDVFLATYHPMNYRPSGVVSSREVNRYMTRILDLPDLDSLSEAWYSVDSAALSGFDREITGSQGHSPRLIIRPPNRQNVRFELEPGTDFITVVHKNKVTGTIPLNSLVIYMPPIQHFFIPRDLRKVLNDYCRTH